MALIVVKPVDGVILHNPDNFHRMISPDGEAVEDSSYWRRRVSDGDAVIVEPDPPIPVPGPGDVKAAAPAGKET